MAEINSNWIELDANEHSTFLDDGIYEKFQGCCENWDVPYKSEEWYKLKTEVDAMELPPADHSFEYRRMVKQKAWCRQRFVVFLSPEWFVFKYFIGSIYFTKEEKEIKFWLKDTLKSIVA